MIITLHWTAVADADVSKYRLKKTSAGLAWAAAELVADVAGTTYQVTVSDGSTWRFYVKAVDSSGNESASAAYWDYSSAAVSGSPRGLLLSLTNP